MEPLRRRIWIESNFVTIDVSQTRQVLFCVRKGATWLSDSEFLFEWNERPANKTTLDGSCMPDNRSPNKASISCQHLSWSDRYISVYDNERISGIFQSNVFSSFNQSVIFYLEINSRHHCRINEVQVTGGRKAPMFTIDVALPEDDELFTTSDQICSTELTFLERFFQRCIKQLRKQGLFSCSIMRISLYYYHS